MNENPRLRHLAIRYGSTIFLSAFLLFQVQPLLANYILPWFGGSSSVWTGCLLFFQMLLVGGYAYAHLLDRLRLRHQARIHLVLLALSLLLLPITPSEGFKPDGGGEPVLRILVLLAVSVGVPYFVLSSTGPLLQNWFARDSRGASPYRLFALSNAASLLGLITYPFLVKPALEVGGQTVGWSWGYGLFVLACGWCAIWLWNTTAGRAETSASDASAASPSRGVRGLWLALTACASLLLLGITNQLTSEVAAVPFLWVLPLILYLLTFIISFDRPRWYSRRVFAPLFGISLFANTMIFPLIIHPHWITQVLVASLTVFSAAMVCHGELVRLRPDPRHLTGFYLTISVGGAMGGIFVALIAPLVFPGYWEVPLGLLAVLILFVVAMSRDPDSLLASGRYPKMKGWTTVAIGLVGPLLMGVPLLSLWSNDVQKRTFYGVHKVADRDLGTPGARRLLRHGTTLHGTQLLDEDRKREPISYYGPGTGLDLAFRRHPSRLAGKPLRIGVLGLGAGTIAAYSRAGDRVRFFELDPQVEIYAREYFTFLEDASGDVDVVLGDGRLSLEREIAESAETYDLLVVDAFSGGSIPIHLLTRECFEIYAKALRPDGVMAIHVSNKYLRLAPVIRAGAENLGWEAVQVLTDPDEEAFTEASHWVVATANRALLDDPELVEASTPWGEDRPPIRWTDRRSSLVSVLR